jgi:exodeoxyribonuclease V alpha subunit
MSTEEIIGIVERITFQNPENGFTVAHLEVDGFKELVPVIGHFPVLKGGETLRCRGTFQQHLLHGKQFQVSDSQPEIPQTEKGIERYLGSGLIKGIGPSYAKKIVAHFGKTTLSIIEKEPDRLLKVKGLGAKRLEMIKSSWVEQREVSDVMVFLQGNGVSPAFAQRIYRHFGRESVTLLKENPYRLAHEVHGIGFKMADEIARHLGIEKESPARIASGITYLLSELSGKGHVTYPLPLFLESTSKTLEVEASLVQKEISLLVDTEKLYLEERPYEGKMVPFVTAANFWVAERNIANLLRDLIKTPSALRAVDPLKAVPWVEKELGLALASEQQQGVAKALQEKVMILTGGPGTGKSTITKAILALHEKLTKKIILLAPTGRAAKRMHEITGRPANTIHSKLEFDFLHGTFKRNRENPLEADLIIVDEASMIDTLLMQHLLRAIPKAARLIFIGDVYQLPSVGPGTVLKDLIASEKIPTVHLKQIFRQAQGSRIITGAHDIHQGRLPDLTLASDSDLLFIEKNNPEHLLDALLELLTNRLPKRYGFDPFNEIQVLAPMRKGIVGIDNLNLRLQEKLNPQKERLHRAGRAYAPGDKVMQIKNDYEKEIFNGDIGRVLSIDTDAEELLVTFDGKEIHYPFADLDELHLAYAVSVHKYQGSEAPCIILPVHTTHFKLLYRNLLYTAVTRGRKLVVLIGMKQALQIAVRNNETEERFTGLEKALREKMTPLPYILY